MKKTFPKIIFVDVHGNNKLDKAAALKYVRRGIVELFRTENLMKLMKAMVYGRTIWLNETDFIRIDIFKGIKLIKIFAATPVFGAAVIPISEEDEEFGCPPIFVLYSRIAELIENPTGPGYLKAWAEVADGGDITAMLNASYLLGYNPSGGTWSIFELEVPFEAAANTGYWPKEKDGCDVVTWKGQEGGFNCWGYAQGFGQAHYSGPANNWQAGSPFIGEKDGATFSYRAGTTHGSYFSVGGVRIEGPGTRTGAEDDRRILAVYPLGGKYYVLVAHDDLTILPTSFYYEGAYTDELRVYVIDIADLAELTPPKTIDEAVAADWVLLHTYNYDTYATGTHKSGWGEVAGNAFVNTDGEAFFAIPIEAGLHDKRVRQRGDTVGGSGDKYTLGVYPNVPPAPDQYLDALKNLGVHWLHFIKLDLVTGEFTILSTESDSATRSFVSATGSDLSYRLSVSNLGRPRMIRTFGGLDRLYSYDIEEDDNLNASWVNNTVPSYNPATYTDGMDVFDFAGDDTYAVDERYTESRITKGYMHCYDRGKNGTGMTLVDSITTFELNTSVSLRHSGLLNLGDHVDPTYNPSVVLSGNLGTNLPDVPLGTGSVRMIQRKVLDHHPQIPNSWTYIEVEEVYDRATGDSGTVTVSFYEMNVLIASKTFARPIQQHIFWWDVGDNGASNNRTSPVYPDWRYWTKVLGTIKGGAFSYKTITRPAYCTLHNRDNLPLYTGDDIISYQRNYYGFTSQGWDSYQPHAIEGSEWTDISNLIRPFVGDGVLAWWRDNLASGDGSWCGGQEGRVQFSGNVVPYRAALRTDLWQAGLTFPTDPTWQSGSPSGVTIDAYGGYYDGAAHPAAQHADAVIGDSIRSPALYGSALGFYFKCGPAGIVLSIPHALADVAVHRKVEGAFDGEYPYIWLKRKVTVTTDAADIKARVEASPQPTLTESYQGSVFHTKPLDEDPATWAANYTSGEWYIVSNVLTAAQILELTEELAADILSIGVI